MSTDFPILGLGMWFLFCSAAIGCEPVSERDSDILVTKLLDLNSINSLDRDSQLAAYREWSDIYLRTKKLAEETTEESCLKMYLFSIFVAYATSSAESTQHIGRTFLPFFRRQPDRIVGILKEHDFLTESVCKALTGYFELMGPVDGTREKQTFATEYMSHFRSVFDHDGLIRCLSMY